LPEHERRGPDADIGEPALGFVEEPAQLDELGAHLAGGRAVLDELARLGEDALGLHREIRVGHAQRDLDQLEVLEVARDGLFERGIAVAGIEQRDRLIDGGAHRVELLDRLVLGGRCLG